MDLKRRVRAAKEKIMNMRFREGCCVGIVVLNVIQASEEDITFFTAFCNEKGNLYKDKMIVNMSWEQFEQISLEYPLIGTPHTRKELLELDKLKPDWNVDG